MPKPYDDKYEYDHKYDHKYEYDHIYDTPPAGGGRVRACVFGWRLCFFTKLSEKIFRKRRKSP